MIGFLSRSSKDQSLVAMIYHYMIKPKNDYCCYTWAVAAQLSLSRLDKNSKMSTRAYGK